MSEIEQSLTLPCGAVLSNRLVKSAMSEGLASVDGVATDRLARLYELWSNGGSGLLISGNIMIDRSHRERMGNVAVEPGAEPHEIKALQRWTAAATVAGNHVWAQLNHPGRQISKLMNPVPKAPSAVPLEVPLDVFGAPQPLSVDEIHDIVRRFAYAAAVARDGGFTGVEIHAAHGFLLSQFLSPHSNRRDDEYGGDLVGRSKLLRDVCAAVRAEVGASFPVAVKLNSSDFRRGGFSAEDSIQVARWLEEDGIDLIEISGGNYEQPRSQGNEGSAVEDRQASRRIQKQDAYFISFAQAMRSAVSLPILLTGGIRNRAVMEQVLEAGDADLIGIGRPNCTNPDIAGRLLRGEVSMLPSHERDLTLFKGWRRILKVSKVMRMRDMLATMHWYNCCLQELADDGVVDLDKTALEASQRHMHREMNLHQQAKSTGSI